MGLVWPPPPSGAAMVRPGGNIASGAGPPPKAGHQMNRPYRLVECDCARLLTTVKADGLQSALSVSVPFPLKGERGMKASDRLRNRVLIRRVEAKEKTPGGII